MFHTYSYTLSFLNLKKRLGLELSALREEMELVREELKRVKRSSAANTESRSSDTKAPANMFSSSSQAGKKAWREIVGDLTHVTNFISP